MEIGSFQLRDRAQGVKVCSAVHRGLASANYSDAARLLVAGGLKHVFFDVENLQRCRRPEINLGGMSAIDGRPQWMR